MTSIYIHIPFCIRKCNYCDFTSYSCVSEEGIEKYFKYLVKEMGMNPPKDEIESIFIGGGTPSFVDSKYIEEIFKALKKFPWKDGIEITLEANPNSITHEKLKVYKDLGVNRISLGVQSFNEEILKKIGRVHKNSDTIAAVQNVRASGFKNLNLDLMLALPDQKMDDVEDSLREIASLNPDHISYYSLIIEPGTPMEKFYKEGSYTFPNEELDRKMYRKVVEGLKKLGYYQYEISNFAKVGFESVHNLRYWKIEEYIGYGLSASSSVGEYRYTNVDNFKDYFDMLDEGRLTQWFREKLTNIDRLHEYMIMGLRLNEGIDVEEAEKRFQIDLKEYYRDEIEKNLKYKTIKFENDRIFLTEYGRDISNQVELDFMK